MRDGAKQGVLDESSTSLLVNDTCKYLRQSLGQSFHSSARFPRHYPPPFAYPLNDLSHREGIPRRQRLTHVRSVSKQRKCFIQAQLSPVDHFTSLPLLFLPSISPLISITRRHLSSQDTSLLDAWSQKKLLRRKSFVARKVQEDFAGILRVAADLFYQVEAERMALL